MGIQKQAQEKEYKRLENYASEKKKSDDLQAKNTKFAAFYMKTAKMYSEQDILKKVKQKDYDHVLNHYVGKPFCNND